MLLYHVTYHADRILAEGFHDSTGWHCQAHELWSGVWLESRPNQQQGPGTRTLVVDLPEDVVAGYEHVHLERNLPYREFIVPAEVVNRHARPSEVGPAAASA